VDIEHDEYFVNLLLRLLLVRFVRHHLVKLVELYLPTAIGIQLGDHLVHCCGLGLNPQRIDSLLQL